MHLFLCSGFSILFLTYFGGSFWPNLLSKLIDQKINFNLLIANAINQLIWQTYIDGATVSKTSVFILLLISSIYDCESDDLYLL